VQELRIKLSADLVEQIEELAKKRNVSKADIVREAILYYLGISDVAGKAIESSDAKVITALYSGKCKKCGKEITPGDPIGLIRIKFEGEENHALLHIA
jgi:Ribbon-helix-helix protein, copG family.